MLIFAIAACLVPVVDQTVKRLVHSRVAARRISLGAIGSLRVVHARIWVMRTSQPVSLRGMWIIWMTGTALSASMSAIIPDAAWAFGLLAGGAFSHALETTLRGCICDYVCVRFWPAFNFADVALTAGALGVPITLLTAIS
jgi:signal peptidase II